MDFKGFDNVRASDDIREELQPYVLTQYSASPTITRLLGAMRKEIDAQPLLEGFYDTLYSLSRCGAYGMDVWSVILNIPTTFALNGERFTPTGETLRLLLWLKAAANISRADLAATRKLIDDAIKVSGADLESTYFMNLLEEASTSDGSLYNAMAMHVRLAMVGEISDAEKTVLMYMLPFILSAGVGWSWLVIEDTDSVFGFLGSELQPFDQGIFVPESAFVYGFDS